MPIDLPLLLAGPIVRRVEPTSCAFWIALSQAATVRAHIWEGTQMAGSSPGTVASNGLHIATSEAVPLRACGKNLFIGVVQIQLKPNEGRSVLTPGAIYAYDLEILGAFGVKGLKDLELLKDKPATATTPGQLALGYVEDRLPSFVAPPPTLDRLSIVHTSCRKSNGAGYDALAWLDDRLKATYTDVNPELDGRRPQQLFMTGDQIYADDVGACLLPMLNQLGQDLVGQDEYLLVSGSNGNNDWSEALKCNMTNFPAMRRRKLVRQAARLSSTDCDNHLLSFGEYAAMYLASWSPQVWRALATDDDLFVSLDNSLSLQLKSVLTDWETCHQSVEKWKEASKKDDKGIDYDRKQVTDWRSRIPKVARALANIATFMILDDHEVTDDWNLNKRWRNRVLRTDLGKNIIQNAMLAYGLFQGWGNDPVAFTKDKNKAFFDDMDIILGQRPNTPPTFGQDDNTAYARMNVLLGLTDTGAGEQVKWNYTVPGPRHLTVVMDTRTHRKFTGQGIAPASLLGDTLEQQVPAGPFTDGKELLILISAAPVLLPSILEQIGAPIYSLVSDFRYGWDRAQQKADDPCNPGGKVTGAEDADTEGWGANEPAREQLLKRLAGFGKAVILSGDVHYACSMEMDFWTGTKPARIAQLVSSASHNSFMGIVEALVRSNALLQSYEKGLNPERLAWDGAAPLTLAPGTKISPGRRSRMRRSPALLPSRGWPAGVSIPAGDDKQPKWRWRLKLVRDLRPDNALPPDIQLTSELKITSDLNPADASTHIPVYRQIAARHQRAAQGNRFQQLRQIVFTTNIGVVEFSGADATLSVKHTLLSRQTVNDDKGAPNTVHVIALAPTTDAPPTLQNEG